MKKSLLLLTLCSILFTVAAQSEPIVISTGIAGGVYSETYGRNLEKILLAKKIAFTTINSAGSMENLARLEKNEAQVGFATYDAYALYLKKGGATLNILMPLKEECGYLVVHKEGKVRSQLPRC